MAMDENLKNRYMMMRELRRIKAIEGSGTELVSLYIPEDYPLGNINNMLRSEYGQASNIKSKSTRKNVMAAIDKILTYVKPYNKAPRNGMALFCGNVSRDNSVDDVQLFTIVPPQKLEVQLYRCDSSFLLEPLERMIDIKNAYGLVVMDGREATIAILRGTSMQIVKKMNSTAHAKIRKGGQSARRYERLIQESIELYYTRIGEAMNEHLLGRVEGIIVGGPGPAKDFFLRAKSFNYQFKIIGMVDTGYTDEYGVRELVEKAKDLLAEQEIVKENAMLQKFVREAVGGGLAAYGLENTLAAIYRNQASVILVSEGSESKVRRYKCAQCGTEFYGANKCPLCQTEGTNAIGEKPLLDAMLDLAIEKDMEYQPVSAESAEGKQFLMGFQGIGAFLRYR